jgi:hypothetical protein
MGDIELHVAGNENTFNYMAARSGVLYKNALFPNKADLLDYGDHISATNFDGKVGDLVFWDSYFTATQLDELNDKPDWTIEVDDDVYIHVNSKYIFASFDGHKYHGENGYCVAKIIDDNSIFPPSSNTRRV